METSGSMEGVAQNQSPAPAIRTYVYVAVAGFLLSAASLYVYTRFVQGRMAQQADQQFFYLILILFGVAVAALLFGVMNSYASLKGQKLDTKFQFTGPVVGVILTVVGGFYLPKGNAAGSVVTIRLVDAQKQPVTNALVKLYVANTPQQNSNHAGEAVFTSIPDEQLHRKTRIAVSAAGYALLSVDTLLAANPIELTLAKTETIVISGRVKDAGEYPIREVEVNVDGTPFHAYSVTDGSYTLKVNGYTVGEEITIITSHPKYEDKVFKVALTAPELKNVDIVLKPVTP